jgi:hypothetical protein
VNARWRRTAKRSQRNEAHISDDAARDNIVDAATPALHVAISGMLTNTHCISPYRGPGRPEASYMIERRADEMRIAPPPAAQRTPQPDGVQLVLIHAGRCR